MVFSPVEELKRRRRPLPAPLNVMTLRSNGKRTDLDELMSRLRQGSKPIPIEVIAFDPGSGLKVVEGYAKTFSTEGNRKTVRLARVDNANAPIFAFVSQQLSGGYDLRISFTGA